jgi:hypothetical protein
MLIKSGATLLTVRRDSFDEGFERVELRLEALTPPVSSFEARFFADDPGATASTAIVENPHYLGSQFFYGLGVPDAPVSPNVRYDIGRQSQSAPTEIRVNITTGICNYLKNSELQTFPISVIAVDRDGSEIAAPELNVEGVSLYIV